MKYKKRLIIPFNKANVIKHWFYCGIDDCNKMFTRKHHLKHHKIFKHNIDVIWFNCDIEDCNEPFKSKYHLKRHKSHKHDIDVKWFRCVIENCSEKFKRNEHLTRHKSTVHDIGQYKCNICDKNVSCLTYDKKLKMKICRICYNKHNKEFTRKEKQMSMYLDENFGTEFLIASDNRINGEMCQKYRPDKLYAGPNTVIHIECDEYQHCYGISSYTCDEKRISDIYDEFPGKQYTVIRWNPDNYKSPNGIKLKKQERLELLLKCMKHIQKTKMDSLINIVYMFYNEDNEIIAKNINKFMVYNEDDIKKIR